MYKINLKDLNIDISSVIINELDEDKYDIYIADLSEIPHGKPSSFTKGKNGIIEFYNIKDKGLKVLSNVEELDDNNIKAKGLAWRDVSYWSFHPSRKLEIVTLSNGNQIFTDNDDRAIYGINPSTNKYIRTTPTKAKDLNIKVPTVDIYYNTLKYTNFNIEDFSFPFKVKTLKEARNIQLDFKLNNYKTIISYNKESKMYEINPFKDCFHLKESKKQKDIYFTTILNIDYTDREEDGYDLTVPDGDTFLDNQGTILSNTMNVHVPALKEAKEDVKEKLMPSRQVFSIRDNDNVVNSLKQDLISGLYSQLKKPSERKWLFRTEEEAIKAIKSGKVKLSDEVEIIET